MQIKLREFGPPMWFVGEPKAIKLSLTYLKPGPVDLDFEKLTFNEQAHILKGIKSEIIETDTDYEVLYQHYTNNIPKIAASAPPPTEKAAEVYTPVEEPVPNPILPTIEDRQKKEEKFLKRCDHLHKQTSRALQAALRNTKDIRLVRSLYQMESTNKKRSSVMDFLKNLLRRLQGEVTLNLQQAESEKPLKNIIPAEPVQYMVTEEDQETIEISVE